MDIETQRNTRLFRFICTEEMVQDYLSGLSISRVALKHDVNKITLGKALKARGVTRDNVAATREARRRLSLEEEEKASQLCAQGHTVSQVDLKFGVCRKTILGMLRKKGIDAALLNKGKKKSSFVLTEGMVESYLSGLSLEGVALVHGVKGGTLWVHLRKLGIVRDRATSANRIKKTLSDDEKVQICSLHSQGWTLSQLGSLTGVNWKTIEAFLRRKELQDRNAKGSAGLNSTNNEPVLKIEHEKATGESKICFACKTVLPVSCFYFRVKAEGKRMSRCRRCMSEARSQNAPALIERAAKYYQNNKEHIKARQCAYQKANVGTMTATRHRRRAMKFYCLDQWTAEQWQILLQACGGKCLRCGVTKDICRDHVVPLVKGGSNSISNLQPLCRSCNSKKGTQHVDWRDEKTRALAFSL